MKSEISVSQWNEVTVFVTQALLGLISPNFRRVALVYENNTWTIEIVLEHESRFDTEQIADYLSALDAYDLRGCRWQSLVRVNSGALLFPTNNDERVIYWRREEAND